MKLCHEGMEALQRIWITCIFQNLIINTKHWILIAYKLSLYATKSSKDIHSIESGDIEMVTCDEIYHRCQGSKCHILIYSSAWKSNDIKNSPQQQVDRCLTAPKTKFRQNSNSQKTACL